jgi:predicted nucleic acid-binding protein
MASPSAAETFVLDSWPIMEWLQEREPASSRYDELIERAMRGEIQLLMSRINFGEVLYSCWKLNRVDRGQLLADAEALPIGLISVDDSLVREAAELKSRTRASYADCFAAAVALRLRVPVVTGDSEFRDLVASNPLLTLHWIGA